MLKGLLKKHKDKKESSKSKSASEPMGCGSSAPQTKAGGASEPRANQARKPAAASDPSVPDVGLLDTHKYVKFLGRGGTGDAHLYEDLADGERVAVKLMKRPLPKVIMPNILREIKVGCWPIHCQTTEQRSEAAAGTQPVSASSTCQPVEKT